jgi:hypothetical protein
MISKRSVKFAFSSLLVLPGGQGASALNVFAKEAYNNLKLPRRLKGIHIKDSRESFNAFSLSYGYSSPAGDAKAFTYLSDEELLASNDISINLSQAVSTTASSVPVNVFTVTPTSKPSSTPTYKPTSAPSRAPTYKPTSAPSNTPTHTPTSTPSSTPTHTPTSSKPSSSPTKISSSSVPVPVPSNTIPTRAQAQEALVQNKNVSSNTAEQAAENVEGSTTVKVKKISPTAVTVIAGAVCVGFISIGAAAMVMRRRQPFGIPR